MATDGFHLRNIKKKRYGVAVILLSAAVGLLALTRILAGPPPPPPRRSPGSVKGRIRARWLAPYVFAVSGTVGKTPITTVRWFNEKGEVVKELSGPGVSTGAGFVREYKQEKSTIHAINGSWSFALQKKGKRSGYIHATPDSRTFVHQFHPDKGQIAVDIYVQGKLAGTVGPFEQYRGESVELGDDGSTVLVTWKKESDKKVPQIVVAGPDGKVTFKAQCLFEPCDAIPAPGGAGAIVRPQPVGPDRGLRVFFDKSGKSTTLNNLGNQPDFFGWAPETCNALIRIGNSYNLIDCSNGKYLWTSKDPARGKRRTACHVLTKDYVLISGYEYMKWGEREDPVNTIYALDIKNGNLVASWLPNDTCFFRLPGEITKLAGKVYFIGQEEFSEINLSEIADKKNGWR